MFSETKVEHEVAHQLESLVLAVDVEKENPSDKAEALAVANLTIEQRVGFKQIEEGQLADAQVLAVVGVRGECPTC